MPTIRKNGKQYDSGDVTVSIFGQLFDEVTEIGYSTEQEHQKNFSLNNKATSWSKGKINDSGSIGLYMTEARRLEKAAGPGKMLMDIKPFDINVSFVNDDNEIVNDTIVCKFTTQGREVNGDMGLKMVYELFVLEVKYGN
jgi:hypothetical protein